MSTLELKVVYTGDSANYHIFQITESEEAVGSIYIRKKSENGIPETLELEVVTPSKDHEGWIAGVHFLLDKVREGSKAENKLIRVLQNYDKPQ